MNENRSGPPSANRAPGRPGGRPGGPPGRGPGGVLMRGEKPKDFKGSMKKLLSYLSPFKFKLFIVALCCVLSTVFTIVGPKLLALVTDELYRGTRNLMFGGSGDFDFSYISNIILGLLALYLISTLFLYLQGFTMTSVSTKVTYNLRDAIMDKINRLPVSFFHTMTHGEVLSRITNDVDTLSMNLRESITQIFHTITQLIGVLILMLTISWQLTLIAMCMIPLSAGFTALMIRISQKYFRAQQKYLGTVNGYVEEAYGGHTVIKAFNSEERTLREFGEENNNLYNAAWRAQFLTGLMMPIMHFIGNVGYVVICMVGAYFSTIGTMSVGGIQAFITYIRSFTQPITQVANISNQLQSTAAAAERIFEFLSQTEESDDNVKYTMKEANIRGDIRFEHVRFSYGDPDNPVIKDFSAAVKAGQKVAIVGPTGAGKTTMVKLLMRFHDIQNGAIYVDDYDIRDFSRADMRTEFGMVLQDTWLYNGTIMENIRYGNPEATDEEVYAAARAAQVDHFVRSLPDSYQLVLNEETTNISQGQKQLLTIARAILANSKILILDEATSSVDTRTEILIQRAMDNLLQGRTSFIIAHRLSTIRNADLILCMRDGDIVEMGNHTELMALNGFYAQLYNSQFETVGVAD